MPPPGFEPFVRAICANPDEDTLRLVYADWLDENGDPDRAAFIRLQIEWARTDHKLPRHAELRDRVIATVRAHGEAWLAELPRAGISWDMGFSWGTFVRGFPSVCSVTNGGRFVDVAGQLFALAPIEHLLFPRVALAQVVLALACPQVAPIRGFTVVWTGSNQPWDDLCEHLAGFTHLTRIESLWCGYGLTDRGGEALARAHCLPQLRELGLERASLSDSVVLKIAARLDPARVCRFLLPPDLSDATKAELEARFGDAYVARRKR